MNNFILKLSKENTGNLLLDGEITAYYGLTEITVQLNAHAIYSELEVCEND